MVEFLFLQETVAEGRNSSTKHLCTHPTNSCNSSETYIYIVFALNSVFLLSSLRENIDIISRMELSVKHLQSTHTGAAYSYHEPHLAEDLNKGNRSRVKTERLGLLVNYILA